MAERDELLGCLARAGGDPAAFAGAESAFLLAEGSRVLASRAVEGIELFAEALPEGVRARLRVKEGVRLARPLHLCFGVLARRADQRVLMKAELEKGAEARLVAHCLFPDAERVRHRMVGVATVGEGASLRYDETHFHGDRGGAEVTPRLSVRVGRGGSFRGSFELLEGRAGELTVDYEVEAAADAVAELATRIFARGEDRVRIHERIVLAGERSRGLVKARIALCGRAFAEVRGVTEGRAAGARGHVDCTEIVRDEAVASAVPVVRVTHPGAKVTHEASIGSVDQRQMETLMAHGLPPEEAVEVIIKGMLG